MPNFQYQALDSDGKRVAGNIEADGVQQAIADLHARGMLVQSIGLALAEPSVAAAGETTDDEREETRPTYSPNPYTGEGVEKAVLQAHMATILERGRAIAPALRAFAEEMPAGWQRGQLMAVCDLMARNNPAAATATLARMPECWIPLLSAATSSADPSQVLHEFLEDTQRADELRHKWWLALAYPVAIVALTAVVMTALSIFVIPEFRDTFKEFGLQLPGLSLLVLQIGSFLSSWGKWIVAALLVLFAMILLNANRLVPSSPFDWFSDRFRLFFGRSTAIARFARFMADLLDAGVSLPDALRVAGYAVNRPRMKQAAWGLAHEIESTGRFSPKAYSRPLTLTVLYALSPSIAPDTRVRLLRDVSTCYTDRSRIGLSWVGGIVEPIAVCVIGFVVGMTVIALFIPLVKLVEGLSN